MRSLIGKYAQRFSEMFVRWPLYLSQGPCDNNQWQMSTNIVDIAYSCGNVICGALSTNPHEDLHCRQFKSARVVGTKLTDKWLQKFQSLRLGVNDNFSLGLRFRGGTRVEYSPSRGETVSGKVLTSGRSELERFAICKRDWVSHRVEREFSREGHSRNDCRRSKEVHGLTVSIVSWLEIPTGFWWVKCWKGHPDLAVPVEWGQNSCRPKGVFVSDYLETKCG